MFIVEGTYIAPLEEVDRLLDAHRAYLDRHFASGDFITFGPKIPRTGGVIVSRDMSRRELERILREDPFNIEKVAECRITEFKSLIPITR